MATSTRFPWPADRRAAVSLSFDDTRPSQLDIGLPILDRYGVKATFYATLGAMERRLTDWQRAAAQGHEIGNHTVSHPCSGNFLWSREKALEDYTWERMEAELTEASAQIERRVGQRPTTFAYPCGQKFIGRGEGVRSYVPLVATYFQAGRGFREEALNDPAYFDPAQTAGVDFDGLSVDECRAWIERAREEGGWLVLAGHDVGDGGRQTVLRETLEMICQVDQEPESGVWIDTVAAVAAWVMAHRRGGG